MDATAEKRYQTLKRKLDGLHYCQPFSKNWLPNTSDIESCALVERLFNDFVKATDGFQKLKKKSDLIQKDFDQHKE